MNDAIKPRPIRTPTAEERAALKKKARDALQASRDRAQRNERLFMSAWKRGIVLAGEQYFTCRPAFGESLKKAESVQAATHLNQLAPDYQLIMKTIGALSSGQRKFLAAMCSFYNSEWGGDLLRDQGVNGLADLSATLDNEHLQVIADLLVSYSGW